MNTPIVNIAILKETHYRLKLASVLRREPVFQNFLNKILEDWLENNAQGDVPGQTAKLPVSDLVDQR